ncbi:alcohol dehydrogenase transcription factor myb/SANT-like domain-containing protein [Phthorimaea operculella]|nr:alcohol dehydrogenase transcription factor myb/SANT-like domain-containing protein [Phthorimaea operculella]
MSFEIPLVLEIEKRPCLYNSNMPEYNRKEVLEDAWKEIASVINLTVYECKDKWKNIRSSFVRSLRTHGGKTKKPYYLCKYLQFLLPYLKPLGVDLSNIDFSDLNNTNLNNTNLLNTLNTNTTEQPEEVQDDVEETAEAEVYAIKLEPDSYDKEQDDDPLSDIPVEIEEDKPARSTGRGSLKRRHMLRNQASAPKSKYRKLLPSRTENPAIKYFLLSLLPEIDTMDEDQVRTFKIKVMMLIDEIKTNAVNAAEDISGTRENIRLQKRLINLLLKNLAKNV